MLNLVTLTIVTLTVINVIDKIRLEGRRILSFSLEVKTKGGNYVVQKNKEFFI